MKEKEITVDLTHLKARITAMLYAVLRSHELKPNEPFETDFSEKELLGIILISCPWLKVTIEECVNEMSFDISCLIKDEIKRLTGKKEDA